MEQDFDADDVRSLSERVLPLASVSYTNNVSPRNSNRTRSVKPQKSISSDNQIYHDDVVALPTAANPGDIRQLADGTRQKYNGSSWRRMCSKPNCSYYTQSGGLCKPHLAALKKRKTPTSKDNAPGDEDIVPAVQPSAKPGEPKKGDIIVLSNGIRKKHDGRQYRRICANVHCAVVVHGSLEYQKGLCPQHYQESRNKTQSNVTLPSETESPPPPPSSSIVPPQPAVPHSSASSSRKRRRAHSPSYTHHPSQVSLPETKSSPRRSIATIPSTVDMQNPTKGDIIQMETGSRKKFDGVVWRKICSLPDCFIAAQRNELCRKHFIKLNGKPHTLSTNDILGSISMVTPLSKSLSSMSTSSTDEKLGSHISKKIKEESLDYDEEQPTDPLFNLSDNEAQTYNGDQQEDSSINDDDHLETRLDHSLINTLSSSRQKFPTNHLKKWLRDHRTHPYPTNQEKIELAKQSAITYDQVTTWFNNARAILRRRQAKLRHSLDAPTHDDEDEDDDDGDTDSLHVDRPRSDSNNGASANVHRSMPLFNGVCYRSVGVQCNPSTVNQTTSISVLTDDELQSDRAIRIVAPSSHVLRNNAREFLIDDVTIDDDETDGRIIVTSTCLDDEQVARLKEFCARFQIQFSNAVDELTTHLITDEEDGETLVCPLSKKVIQAVARHMYIVTYRWIDACLEANKLINEKPFEIQGDLTLSADHNGMQRSRQSVLPSNLPLNLLLEHYSIMLKCDGCQEMMNNEELIELVRLSGAKHMRDSHFSRLQTGLVRVVLCEKEYLINRKDMYEKCVRAGVHFLTPEWFLESLVQYRIQPYQEYQISP